MKVAGVEEIRAMDRWAIEKWGIPEEILMENAGSAAYYALAADDGAGPAVIELLRRRGLPPGVRAEEGGQDALLVALMAGIRLGTLWPGHPEWRKLVYEVNRLGLETGHEYAATLSGDGQRLGPLPRGDHRRDAHARRAVHLREPEELLPERPAVD